MIPLALLFWIAASLAAAASVVVMLLWAKRRGLSGGPDAALRAHQQQLEEIDSLAERGVWTASEANGARNEAARRLLFTAGRNEAGPREESRGSRIAAFAAALAVPTLALLLYLMLGSPGADDAPFSRRVSMWRGSDPATLGPQQLAAVLEQASQERPDDWRAAYYLGQATLASGDSYGALRAFDRARVLAPREAGPLEGAGEALVSLADGRVDPDAVRAFEAALRLNPQSIPARFHLGRARLVAGDRAGATAMWRAAMADLPDDDPRRQLLAGQIADVDRPGGAPAEGADPMIRGMVASLAARLDRSPDDPGGWARLIRSYRVLDDEPAAQAALARARRVFAGRPEALRIVEQQGR